MAMLASRVVRLRTEQRGGGGRSGVVVVRDMMIWWSRGGGGDCGGGPQLFLPAALQSCLHCTEAFHYFQNMGLCVSLSLRSGALLSASL